MTEIQKLPVTVLSGFLGAGKEIEVKFKKIESYLSKGYQLAAQTTT